MKNNSVARNIFWNTIGNLSYLGCLWLLNFIVIQLSGSYRHAGILTLAISVTNIFAVLARFSVRDFQVSDMEQTYQQSDYISLRVITCSAALLGCIGFVVLNGYEMETALCIVAYMIMRTVECAADVIYGILQKRWRLDVAGKAQVIRGCALLLSFALVYWRSGRLTAALFAMAGTAAVVFFLYDIRRTRRIIPLSFGFRWDRILPLAAECLPMLAYSFFFNLIVPTSRFFLERFHGQEMLGYYGTVSTIAVIVQAAVNYIFNPLNGVFTSYYAAGDRKAVLRLFYKVIGLLLAAISAALCCAALLGRSVLVLVLGESIAPYVYLLFPTIFASGLTGLAWFLGMLLVVQRLKKVLIFGAAAGFLVSLAVSVLLTPRFVFDGANIAMIAALSVTALIYLYSVVKSLPKPNTEKKECNG